MDKDALERLAAGSGADVHAALDAIRELEKLTEAGVVTSEGYSITPPLGRPAGTTQGILTNAAVTVRGKLGLTPR